MTSYENKIDILIDLAQEMDGNMKFVELRIFKFEWL